MKKAVELDIHMLETTRYYKNEFLQYLLHPENASRYSAPQRSEVIELLREQISRLTLEINALEYGFTPPEL